MSLQPAAGTAFIAAFPQFVFYYVIEKFGTPGHTHIMAWDEVGLRGYDATADFNALLSLSGAVVATATDALRYGKAFAEAATAELQHFREVVDAADSSALGRTIPDPSATPLLGGWRTDAWTWADENGVLATWSVTFSANQVSSATWQVEGLGVGTWIFRLEGIAFQQADRVSVTYGTTATLSADRLSGGSRVALRLPHAVETMQWDPLPVTERTNFDGSKWIAHYPSVAAQQGVPETVLQAGAAFAEGGVFAYRKQIVQNTAPNSACSTRNDQANWGFESKDPNCKLDILVLDPLSLQCVACYAGDHPEMKIYIAPYMKEYLNARGYYLDPQRHSLSALSRVVVGHEHFHYFQVGLGNYGNAFYMEGMARFAQTILDPVVEDEPTSLWYGTSDAPRLGNGVNYFALHPDTWMCRRVFSVVGAADRGHTYDYGLYWGFLYRNEVAAGQSNNITLLRDLLVEFATRQQNLGGGAACEQAGAEGISAVLASNSFGYASHADALADFALKLYTKDFSWAPHGQTQETWWGRHLVSVKPEAHAYGPTALQHQIRSWGMQFVPLVSSDTRSYSISYTESGTTCANATFRVRVVRKLQNEAYLSDPPICPGQVYVLPADALREDAFIQVLRQTHTSGTYNLTVIQA